ncbi:VOC family protein [Frateuria defendens]|uniref:VOC family protein n=1 Tax=Frateuria defendens TaxID=2219559 RepID=UPI00066FBBFA|nr:VOC family protein [Frateuria defendens]
MFRNGSLKLALFLLLALGAAAPAAHAGDDDYVRLDVPQLQQAVTFFHEVMGCEPLEAGPAGSALLECAHGMVLELAETAAANGDETGGRVRFRTDDARSMAAWLRSRHLMAIEHSRPATPGRVVTVDFLTPWGLPLEVVGYDSTPARESAGQLAAQ